MRISISNIAWDISEDDKVSLLLNKFGVDAIDIAPTKYFTDLMNVSDDEILLVKNAWKSRGVDIVAMQSLLFGKASLNLFGLEQIETQMIGYLSKVCQIASKLGVNFLVFGSPKNRNREGLDDELVLEKATNFFRKLGNIAQSNGVLICLEPNPKEYGANFMINSKETAEVVLSVSHPAIKMQLDTGAMAMNHESFDLVIPKYSSLYGHIHLSEPNLKCLGTGGVHHANVSCILKRNVPNCIASIEMLPSKEGANLINIEHALSIATSNYAN